jgi:hypothetical protein
MGVVFRCGRQSGRENSDRDFPLVLQVTNQVNRSMPPLSSSRSIA